MHLWFIFPLLAVLVQARPGSGDFKLKNDTDDNMETRKAVKNILSRMKVKQTPGKEEKVEEKKTKRAVSAPKKEEPEIKPPNVPYPRVRIHEVNKNVSEWMHEGDMLLNIEQAKAIAAGCLDDDCETDSATTNPAYYWDVKTPIYYTIDNSIQNDARKLPLVKAAIAYWQANTCLNFQNSNGPNALNYYLGSGCWSYVGKQGWASQQISIGNGCESLGTVCHETAHALGFYHEQSRSDRDDYVTINLNNIAQNLQYNFVKMTPQTSNNLGVPFDYGSVMQYDAFAFATDRNQMTIVPKDKNYANSMGQREAPAFSDVISVNNLYNCSSICSSKPNCKNSGIVNSRRCSECLCPKMFTGTDCSQIVKGNAANCNGKILQATSSWQMFNGTAGDPNDYNPKTVPTDCYWLIQAPAGRKIQFQVTQASMCLDQCPWQSFDINLGNFELGGMLLCCQTDVFTSTSNQISVRGMSLYNQLRMQFKFKLV